MWDRGRDLECRLLPSQRDTELPHENKRKRSRPNLVNRHSNPSVTTHGSYATLQGATRPTNKEGGKLPATSRLRHFGGRRSFLVAVASGSSSLPLPDQFFVILLRELDVPHVCVIHVVVTSLTPANPLSGIGIGPVSRCVVVPRR